MSVAESSAIERVSQPRIEHLAEAAVGLLASFDDHGQAGALPWTVRVAAGVQQLGDTANLLSLRGLGYVGSLVAPYLRTLEVEHANAALREGLEAWTQRAIAFASGLLDGEAAASLIDEVRGWPGFPAVPAQFVGLIADRLRHDAEEIVRRLGTEALVAVPGEHAPPAPSPAADAQDGGGEITVARDEFVVLAEAAQLMADELAPAWIGLPLPADEASAPLWRRALDELAVHVEHFANAAEYLGLPALALAMNSLRRNAEALHREPAAIVEAHRRLLLLLPDAWRQYFESPDATRATEAVALQAAADWPLPMAEEEARALGESLGRLRLVASRRVAAHDAALLDDESLSLAVPEDTDRGVLDHLLGELPAMSAALADAIDALRLGRLEALETAMRIAHTMKGSANTVGIRGIATLTHPLEDLLQLLERDQSVPDAGLGDDLAAAADCLAEMSDAVAGLGPPPADAATVLRRIVDRVNARVEAAASPDEASPAQSPYEPSPAQSPYEPSPAVPPLAGESEPDLPPVVESPAEGEEEFLRVPAGLVARMLDLAGEASLLLATLHEQVARMDEGRGAIGRGGDRLGDLCAELEQLVDRRAGGRGAPARGRASAAPVGGLEALDALEFERYDELHTVARRFAEVGADSRLIDQQMGEHAAALRDALARLERVQTELGEAALQTRMMPVSAVVPRLRRAVRQAARLAGREATLQVDGERTLVDGALLQALLDPLMHVLRNAVDHGIEPAPARAAVGKPAAGRIVVAFERSGRDLRVSCEDDGPGLDLAAIRRRAIARGLLGADEPCDDARLARFVLAAGFSTRGEATQLSGRGVGLDVVGRALEELRGRIDIDSTPGRGTRFVLTVPMRLAAVPVLIARTGDLTVALSLRGLETVADAAPQALPVADDAAEDAAEDAARRPATVVHAGERLELFDLAALLGAASVPVAGGAAPATLLVRGDDGRRFAVAVERLEPTRNVIVRVLPAWLPRLPGVDGAAVLGDGTAVSVIDLPRLRAAGRAAVPAAATEPLERARLPIALVVDDSVSVRRAMAQFLGDIGFEVDVAGDGFEALVRSARRRPDVAIVDLEMPRMNGLELVRQWRARPATARLPVIMITSRLSERHRALAAEAGVDVFLGKPYTEDDLARRIEDCLRARAGAG